VLQTESEPTKTGVQALLQLEQQRLDAMVKIQNTLWARLHLAVAFYIALPLVTAGNSFKANKKYDLGMMTIILPEASNEENGV
jgi:hypothetical protein